MAASPNYEPSATQTLKPQHPSMNGEDSVPEPSQPPQQDLDQDHSNSQSASADDTVSVGEKRKREDPPPSDQSSLHPLWKTSLCSYFRRNSGSCSHGDSCRYAHGEEELRPRPDNTWDPTSERAKKALRSEESERQERPEEDVMMTEAVVDEDDDDKDDDDKDNDGCLDSELRKCLVHLPRKWHSENLMKFLGEEGVPFKSVKKKKGMTVGFVSFESAVQLKTAQEELKGKSIGNKNLKVADIIPRSFEKKIRSAVALPIRDQQTREPALDGDNVGVPISSNGIEDGDTNNDDKNCSTVDGSVSRARRARDVVTPLAHMSYVDQLEHKRNSLMQILKRLTRNARKACPNGVSLPEWILKSREIGGLPCELEGIIESPLVNGYRNKCEFSAGYSLQGKPTVGFMLGNFREGVTAVEEPVDCPNVSRIACKYASIFQEFLQNSGLPIWNRFNNTGFWRQLTVREGRAPGKVDVENSDASISEVILVVQVCSVGFDDAVITGEFKRLAEAFTEGAAENSPSLPLTALVVQDHQGISNVAPTDAPLRQLPIPKAAGPEPDATADPVEARIHDSIGDLHFCISPTAFFQVNTLAAEKLYSLAGDWAGLGPDTLLFDVCCGTGTIGLTLAHRVGMVIGIEMNASAVSDAYRNAEINGIKNCKFVCAKAEDVMGSLLKEYLNLPQKSDEISNTSESSDKEIATPVEKDTSIDNVLEPEENSSHDHVNNKSASDCLENGGQETGIQQQGNGTSECGNTSVPQFKNVVAIVDPPRVGLHPIVIKALRTHPRLHRLVYISCNPESLVANAIELCTPSPQKIEKGNKNNRGWRGMSSAGLARHRAKSMPISEPFRPVKAMAVDLFPHTVHCEMVMLLER
ncbi:zinc finger CCCH domain-containing protein 24-like [Juglans regia]|uniref:Zinc finger CCCH domain-containing protein 24-like n=2 Tax=Juglans regia TaxID=51240 RepID=A0A2I4DW00_JUGRE|nr:zinc finger CCCH domain-containing protein 24-like [Juglans regia]